MKLRTAVFALILPCGIFYLATCKNQVAIDRFRTPGSPIRAIEIMRGHGFVVASGGNGGRACILARGYSEQGLWENCFSKRDVHALVSVPEGLVAAIGDSIVLLERGSGRIMRTLHKLRDGKAAALAANESILAAVTLQEKNGVSHAALVAWKLSGMNLLYERSLPRFPTELAFIGSESLLVVSAVQPEIWNPQTGRVIKRFARMPYGVYSSAFRRDQAGVLFFPISAGLAPIWRSGTGHAFAGFKGDALTPVIGRFLDDDNIFLGNQDGRFLLFSFASGERKRAFPSADAPITALAFDKKSGLVVYGTASGEVIAAKLATIPRQ